MPFALILIGLVAVVLYGSVRHVGSFAELLVALQTDGLPVVAWLTIATVILGILYFALGKRRSK